MSALRFEVVGLWGLGFGVLGVRGLECGVWGMKFGIWGLGFVGFEVWGFGFVRFGVLGVNRSVHPQKANFRVAVHMVGRVEGWVGSEAVKARFWPWLPGEIP